MQAAQTFRRWKTQSSQSVGEGVCLGQLLFQKINRYPVGWKAM